MNHLRLLTALLLFQTALFSQPININYQTPAGMFVCESGPMAVTVQNNSGSSWAGATLAITLPAGLEYVSGSVSGAGELNVSDPQAPVFGLPVLPPGAAAAVTLTLRAGCDAVEAINGGQLFSAVLQVQAGALEQTVTTLNFPVQTGFLVIPQIDNDFLEGEKGEVLTRTVHVLNSREGPVRFVWLRDVHLPGLSIHIVGAAYEQDLSGQYTALLDGAYFSAFGDGDTLLEFGETLLVPQVITVTDCGLPVAFENESAISAAWSCAADSLSCQGDTAYAEVLIRKSTKKPNLVITTEMGYPFDRCALEASTQRMKIVNQGSAPAQNVLLQIIQQAGETIGLDSGSVRLTQGSVTTALHPNLVLPNAIFPCRTDLFSELNLAVPLIPVGDSVEIRFDAYFCYDSCFQVVYLTPPIKGNAAYPVGCPPGSVNSKSFEFDFDASRVVGGSPEYSFGECLADGNTYQLQYAVTSTRLTESEGVAWLQLDLPWGLFFDPSCLPTAAGLPPAQISMDTLLWPDTFTRVFLAFPLPWPDFQGAIDFCLKSTCRDDANYSYLPQFVPPTANGEFETFNQYCFHCGYVAGMAVLFTRSLTSDLNCALSNCIDRPLRTSCQCPDFDTLPPVEPVDPGACLQCGQDDGEWRHDFNAFRTNLGLADHDNDRQSDPGAVDTAQVRRDRFLPGDTMRVTVNSRLLHGDSICALDYTIFTEVIQSDAGYAGVTDVFPATGARNYFANPDRFQLLDASLQIWDASTGAVHECPLDTALFNRPGPLSGTFQQVNSFPPVFTDQMATQHSGLELSTDLLAQSGCLPDCFSFAGGDSTELTVHFKLDFNIPTRPSALHPPLVNFEMAFTDSLKLPDYYAYKRYDTLMMQYSGFEDTLVPAIYRIFPCVNSIETQAMYYRIQLARGNLFPYEVRPLLRIDSNGLLLPPGLGLPSGAKLTYLRLQDNVPWLENVPLPFGLDGPNLTLDFSPVFSSPVDEGFELETDLVFPPNCTFSHAEPLDQYIDPDFFGCLSNEDTLMEVHRDIGFFSNYAFLTMVTPDPVLEFAEEEVEITITLSNQLAVPVALPWIRIINPENGLTGFQLTTAPQNQPVPAQNGIFSLPPLGIFGSQGFRISAQNLSCQAQQLLVEYGWDCQPYTQPGAPSCFVDTIDLMLVPKLAEMELEVLEIPVEAPLCDTSGYLVFEVLNADLGYAYDPLATVELPPGLVMASGSAELSFPAGAPFVPIPDPVLLPGGVWQWDLAALHPAIDSLGLSGVDLAPFHAARIRFRVVASCGAVSNAQVIFGTAARQSCGLPTNVVRKTSAPLLVDGLAPAYSVNISVQETAGNAPLSCDEEQLLSFAYSINGQPGAGDSLYIMLPPGFTYLDGSYQQGPNAPEGPPQVDGVLLRLELPPVASATGLFTLTVLSPSAPVCTPATLDVQTRVRLTAFCPALDTTCGVYAATGEVSYTFSPQATAVSLLSAGINVTAGGQGIYQAVIGNAGSAPFPLSLVQYFRDVDGDGALSPADTLVFEAPLNQVLPPGENVTVETASAVPSDLCGLLAVMPGAENCACSSALIPLDPGTFDHAPLIACAGAAIPLGVDSLPGLYQWNDDPGLSCLDCANAVFSTAVPGMYNLVLTETRPGCVVVHSFGVEIQAIPELLPSDSLLCAGESTVLATTAAVSWQWQGPDLANPAAPTQTVQPAVSAVYTVVATTSGGCSGSDSVTIQIFALDTVTLAPLYTCEGAPVDIFGQTTDQPGFYQLTLPQLNGCDSTVIRELRVVPHTAESLAHCPGDTVLVFGQPETLAGEYCRTFMSTIGCDSMHCVTLSDFTEVVLEDPPVVKVLPGDSVQLVAPPGFAAYAWAPAAGLSCTGCPNPVAVAADSITYVLTVTSADGCTGQASYRLLVLPPCRLDSLAMPTVFSPDGDGLNDLFRLPDYERADLTLYLEVYDRWGEKIYRGVGPEAAWNGMIGGQAAPAEAYVWRLAVKCGDAEALKYGNVTLLR